MTISGSKSETNRLLLLQALYPSLKLKNISNSNDSAIMLQALSAKDNQLKINVHHAGTAMRFLTAYFALYGTNEVVLTGSDRMKERPIKILVDALKTLEAKITYTASEGYPPIKISPQKKYGNKKVVIPAHVSSQYISALMLTGGLLPNGLEIHLQGTITSLPYIYMTLRILQAVGISVEFKDTVIKVGYTPKLQNNVFTIESDWSSASYYYSITALAPLGFKITLNYFKSDSLQGDNALTEIYTRFGVKTSFVNQAIVLEKIAHCQQLQVNLHLNNTPDIAQTIAVTCLGLQLNCTLTGLHTLKIKETDRLQALKNELQKFGVHVNITNDSLTLNNKASFSSVPITIKTYQDHRMAMAFAPLALKQPLVIKQAEVVSKSYPGFWNDLQSIGFVYSVD